MIVSRRVDLPAPFRPRIATLPPATIPSETPSSTIASPYPAVTPSRRNRSDMGVSEVELPHARVSGDLGGRTFRDHASAREHRDPLSEPEHQRHVVLDEDD